MTEVIGVVAAMSQESRALLHYCEAHKRIPIDQLHAFSFTVAGRRCVLVTSGMGSRRARQATLALLEKAAPGILVSFGIAGAVEGSLAIGDVVLAESNYQLSQGVLGGAKKLAPWPKPAMEAARQVLAEHGRQLFTGTAITTLGSQVSEGQLAGILHPVLEMETAGIASVAAQHGIPLLSLRAISDGPLAPVPLDVASVMDEDANLKITKMLRVLVREPGMLLRSRQLLHNTALAAGYAAQALIAALSQWNG